MANMSYCRFENTAHDLNDCLDVLIEGTDSIKGDYEISAAARLIHLCQQVVNHFSEELESKVNLEEFIRENYSKSQDEDEGDEN